MLRSDEPILLIRGLQGRCSRSTLHRLVGVAGGEEWRMRRQRARGTPVREAAVMLVRCCDVLTAIRGRGTGRVANRVGHRRHLPRTATSDTAPNVKAKDD